MVDIINLYENPWAIASSGTDTLPRGLNPNVYGSSITDPSLYRPLFSSRLATLSDAISCVITEEINGTYTLNMTYPVDGNGAGLIKAGRIIAAKNYPKGSRQLFKITQISKTLKNTITVSGEHLSYDLSDYTLQPITGGAKDQETGELKPISATLNKAIEYIQGMDQYSPDDWNPGWIVGDIYNRTPGDPELGDQPSVQKFPFRFSVANGYYDDNNQYHDTHDYKYTQKEIYSDKIGTVREYVGAAKTGLLSVYGGEVIFDIDDGGYANVIFTPQMGMDRGFKVVYGKNLKSMNYKIQAGKQKSAWFPYYKYTMNSDLHINLFWEIDNDLSSERARQIIGSGVNPYEGQIKQPLVYEHMDDFQSYVNIFPVDVTSEVDQFLKLIGESWGHITPDSHDQPGEAEDKSIMRSWALSVGLSAYWDVNGTLGYAPTSSELTFDFASLYATDSNAVEADVRLGDTVTVLYDEDGTSVKKRVIKMEYDAATGRYKKITLGDPKNKRKTAAGSIAESSLNSVAAIDTAYANAASFNRDVLSLIGEAFNTNLTVKTPLEKTYSVDSISKKPSMGLEIKGTTNDDGKCLTWRHNISDDTWSAVWEEVSRDHYTGQAPISISNQNVISLSYDGNHFRVSHDVLGIKNPLPAAVTGEDEDKYLYVDDNGYISWDDLRLATSSVVGGIKTGYTTSGTNFAVQLDQNGKAYVAAVYGAQDPIYLDGTTFKLRYSTTDFTIANHTIKLVNPLPTGGSDGQVLMWNEGPDWTTLTTSDISNIETWISGKSYATTTYVNEIASGLSAAYAIRATASVNPAFNTQSEYITITQFTTTGGQTISFSDLKVGDTVYVLDGSLPDRWVSEVTSSNAKLYILETVQPAVTDVQIDSSSIVSNRTANIALSSSFSFNTTNNTLSLQKAGSSTLGGIKTGFTTSGTNYKVQVDSNGNAYVTVPGISATAPITYNSSNGKIGISIGSGLTTTGTPAQLILDTEYLDQNYVNNPMTNVGDLIVGGTGGEPTAISKGSAGQVLSSTANGLAWITLPADTNTWRDIGVNGEPWKGTAVSSGAIDFNDNTGIAITTGTGQNANKLYIGLANTYGDSKNPYGSKTAHYVLAAPSNQNGVPTFRVLDASDIPNLSYTKITGIGATTPMSYTGGIIALNYDDTKFTNDGGTLTLAESYYLASNPNNYISRSGISATGAIAYDNSIGVISVASGYTIPTSSSYQPSVWNAKQDSLGTGSEGQALFWHEGGPYWDSLPADTNTWRPIKYGNTTLNDTSTTLEFVAGTNIGLAFSSGKLTITNNYSYTLPLAANGTRGGIQIGYSPAANTKKYAVKLESEKAYVEVPWTDTTYSLTVGTGANVNKIILNQNGSELNKITVPYATAAGEATKDSDSNTIADYYGHALTVSGNTIGLKNAQDDDITGSFITVPYATAAGSANSVAWVNVSGHAAGVKADLAINASSGSTSKYLSEQGTWVSLPSDVNTWRDIGVNTEPWKGTGTGTGPIDFTNDTGISITTGTGQNANKLYIGVDTTKIPLITSLGDLAWLDSIPNNVTGSGTSGYLAKWNGTNTLTDAVQYDTGATNGTIAQRTSQGYLFATYFNTTVGQFSPSSYTSSSVAFIDQDGWLRKSSKTTFMNWINPDIQAYEAKLQWGGRNFAAAYGPIDAAMIGTLGANRFELLRPGTSNNPGIEVFYSRDAGSTWIDYGLSDGQKRNIFNSTAGTIVIIGKRATSDTKSVDDRAKIVIHTGVASVYTSLNKFALYVSTNGSTNCWVTIDKCIQNKDYSVESNWENVVTKVPISGWSGWNIINTNSITTYGNQPASQYGHLRFIFGADTAASTSHSGLNSQIIAGFGGVGWNTPSYLAKYNHAYTWNYAGDAIFQAGLSAYGHITANARDGTASTTGISYLIAGNSTASGTVDNSRGVLRLYGTGSGYANVFFDGSNSTSTNYVFPAYSTNQNVVSVERTGVTSGTLAKFDSTGGHLTSLANGSNGQILAIVNGTLTWSGNINALLPSYSSSDRGKFLVVSEGDGSPAWETLYWSDISSTPTTLDGYGITDAKIQNGAIILGSNSISSKSAASGGTDVSLVTTGEKYTWNNKISNPMTYANDIIVGGTNGAATRLGKGSNGTFLGINSSGNVAWVDNPIPFNGDYDGDVFMWDGTTETPYWISPHWLEKLIYNAGEIIIGSSTGDPMALSKGSTGQVLTTTSYGNRVAWSNATVRMTANTGSTALSVLLAPSDVSNGASKEAQYANTSGKQLKFTPSTGNLSGVAQINGSTVPSSPKFTDTMASKMEEWTDESRTGFVYYDESDGLILSTPSDTKVSMTANTGSTALSVLLGPSSITSGNAYGANYANTSGKQLKFTPSTGNLSGVAQINGSTVPSSPKFTDTLVDYITEWNNEQSGEASGIVKYAYDNVPALYLGSIAYNDMIHSWSTSSNIAMLTMTNTYTSNGGSTNPVLTLSSYPVQNSGTVFKLLNNTAQTSNNWLSALDIMAPNMTASSNMNYANFTIFNCGKAASENNRGSLVYHHTADGSLYNCLTMGFYGNDHVFRVYAYGGAWIYGSLYVENGNKVATEAWVNSNFVPTCLIKGTKILMADGTEKNIEDVKRGDEVKSIDINSGKIITAMIVSCEKTGLNHEYTTHLFDNGSYIVTYGQHSVYNKTLGHPIDISKFRIGDETYNAEGKVITYAGNMRYYDRSTDVAHYDINTSNNMYFANGILNGKNVFAKYRYMRREEMDIPDSILAVLNRQETANKPAIGYETDSNYFRAIAAKLKEKSTIAKRIEEAKQKLADSDYLVAKFTEGLISAVDWLKAKAERGNWRTAINNDEPLLEAADKAIKAIKAKYQTDDSSVKDRFELFSAWDNAALEYYREWLTKEKPIDIPGPLTEEERHGSYANQDLT